MSEVLGLDDFEIENTSIDEIDNEVVNLIFVAIDQSSSMEDHATTMRGCLVDFKQSLLDSKEVDEILLARANFADDSDVRGYKKVDQFDTNFTARGMTALYDVVVEGADKLVSYMDNLKKQGMRVKAVFALFSDGADNASSAKLADARKKIEELNNLEIVTAFIGFGPSAAGIADNLAVKNKLDVGSSASELRKAFNCLSKSVIESSQSVVAPTGGNFFIV